MFTVYNIVVRVKQKVAIIKKAHKMNILDWYKLVVIAYVGIYQVVTLD